MIHTLRSNVLVKWEEYREWTDDATGETWYRWEMRFCVVPEKYAALVEKMKPEESKSFLVLEDLPEGAVTFPYHTVQYTDRVQ